MKSFEPGVLERQAVPVRLLRTIRLLGEYRARQGVFEGRSPRVLQRLRDAALRDSIESTNRLSGNPVPAGRLAEIVAGRSSPDDQSEQEIAGYGEVVSNLPAGVVLADLTPSLVRRLHAGLYRHVPQGGGSWKASDDLVTERLADGGTSVVFTPVPAYGVEDAMNRLHDGLGQHARAGTVDPLLLVPSYLLDFFCIHPFADGNARMLRLLARVLLEGAGYRVPAFVSLDALVEKTRAQFSAALQASWQGWHAARHALAPWWEYFLGVVLEAYEQIAPELGRASSPRGAKRDLVADAVLQLPADFRHADLERLVPTVSRPTINRALRRLRAARLVTCVKPGRSARWRRIGD